MEGLKTLVVTEKQKISYCIPVALRDEHIKINLTKVDGRIDVPDTKKELIQEPIAVVSFGPSLQDTWEELKKFKVIMTCSGAHKFLIEKGIIPTYHVDLEPREHKVKLLGPPQKETQYLIASTIHPVYLDALKGFNVKLWHIFASEEEGARALPRGEWLVTGGSSVGLRCMTLARLLGYVNQHIFGMDGNIREGGNSHTTFHPNAPKQAYETEYGGKKYLTTPSMLHCAQETWAELDQMPDVKTTLYGEGLVQAMAKDYKPNPKHGSYIAFNNPEIISEKYKDLNFKLHQDNPQYGMGGGNHAPTILALSKELKTTSILDYGCGKGMLAKSLPFPIWEYDPAIPDKAAIPKSADIVVCTDVLEHIEPDKLKLVLNDLRRCVLKIGYFVISTRKAVKTYANGENTHLIVQGESFWIKQLEKYFKVGKVIEKDQALHIVVSPIVEAEPDITSVKNENVKLKFYTPNATTKWRAQTVFTKEPSTVEWINSMQPGEILFDVGANVGSYSVLAGVKGIKVFAFEPEAENYAMLIKNLNLNKIEPTAYCIAISDDEKIGTLYAGQKEVGGACHSFNEKIGFDLQEREAVFTQGCFGMTLDAMLENGLPAPHHLKIDVDGLEYKVIAGAEKTINARLKSLLVEVNPNLPQHLEMVVTLQELGFEFDQEQVDKATRKDGPFKGCAEYVFRKADKKNEKAFKAYNEAVKVFMQNKVMSAEVITEPYPHFFIENIMPDEYFEKIVRLLPKKYTEIKKTRGARGYPLRFTANPTGPFWNDVINNIRDLREYICEKFKLPKDMPDDILLIRDMPGYQITPHTDTTAKAVSALFYLATDKNNMQAGTNIYEPLEVGFTCQQGKHYDFNKFKKIKSFPYQPNSLLVFLRTDNSFHGVEPSDCIRNVLLYNIRNK